MLSKRLFASIILGFVALPSLIAQSKVSNAGGNWNNPAIWTPTGVPTSTNNVTISNGHTVVINANINVSNLTIGSGSAAQLRFSGNTARTVSVANNVTVSANATFSILSTSNATHSLTIGGNLLNNGTFRMFEDNNSLCNVIFNRNGNQTVSGTGPLTRFNRITVNMGTSSANVLEVSSTSFTTITNFLTLTNGTFKLSSSGATVVPFTAAATIPATGGLWVDSPTSLMSFSAGVTNSGLIRLTRGAITIGNANNENLSAAGGTLSIEGGTFSVAGRYITTAATTFSMTSGVFRLPNNGSTSTTQAPFQISNAGSSFNMSGGTILIVREGGNGAQDLGFVNTGSSSGSVTGGTLQLGTTGTPASQTISINSTFTVPNLVVSSASVTARLLTNSLTVRGDISVSSGTLNANNLGISLGGNWTNAGTFVPGTGAVTFNSASAQSITRTGGETFNILAFSGSGTKTFGSAITANGNFSINSTAPVDVSASNFSLTLRGNFINNGSFNASSGLVTFSGTASQSIGGTSATTFNNLTLVNTAGAVLNSSVNLLGTLSLNNGTFNTNSQAFTLVSNSAGTARIGQLTGTGDIAGNVIVQRFIPGGATGWVFLGAPISSALTLNDWDDDIYISCPTCPDGSAGGFLSVYTYDETQTGVYDAGNSYVALSTINDVIQPNKGYWVYVGNGPTTTADITIDVTGTVRKNAQTININYTNTGSAADDGWNLIQNPYPSAISWAALRGATPNIDNAIYVYNADLNSGTGGTASYVNGISSPAVGAGGIGDNIPMCQGFYVHSTGATALNALESNKVSSNPTFLKAASTPKILRLNMLAGNSFSDEAVLYYEQNASKNFETDYDAYKMRPNDPLSPVLAFHYNNLDFQINGIAPITGTFSIPVKAITGVTGNFTIGMSSFADFPANACVTLIDKWNNTSTNLRTSSYAFNLPDTTSAPRFELQIVLNQLNISSQITQPSCSNPSGTLVAQGLSAGPWNYTWRVNNTVVRTSLNKNSADSLNAIQSGIVELEVSTAGQCDQNASIFTIIPQTPVAAGFVCADTVNLALQNSIQPVSTANNADTYFWSFNPSNTVSSAASPVFNLTQGGEYTLKQLCTSESGCVDSVMKKIVVVDNAVSVKETAATAYLLKTLSPGQYRLEAALQTNEPCVVNLYDALGNLVKTYKDLDSNDRLILDVDLGSYSRGVYLLTLTSGDTHREFKLIAE